MRIPLTTTLKIDEFVGGKIVVASSQVINGIFDKYPDGRWFITQRPAINISVDASEDGVAAKGRGIYDWDAVGSLYWVNGGEVYKGNNSTPVRESAITLTSLTSSSTTATATYVAHGKDIGDTVVIEEADQTEYNGTYTVVTVPTADTFTYTFAGSATTPATGTITARRSFRDGVERVYFFVIDTKLIILDPENNVGWYVDSSASTTLVKIEDANFPANVSGKALAKGAAALNGRLYVMDTDGDIYASDILDPIAFDPLKFLNAELEQDGGVCLWLSDQTIVAFGNRTIEFFYDADSPTGSPIRPRTDISYQIGLADQNSVTSESGTVFFCGISQRGEVAAYMMKGVSLKEISTPDITSFLTSSIVNEDKSICCSSFSVGGRLFYLITLYHVVDVIVPLTSLLYNVQTDTWTTGELMQDGIDNMPIVGITLTTRTQSPSGILSNGDIITIEDDFVPNDRYAASGWVESGWVETGWVSSIGKEGTPIQVTIIPGPFDNGTNNRKSAGSLRAVCTQTEVSQTLNIYWSNETNRDYQATPKTLDLSNIGRRVRRCGKFRRRNHKLVFASTERLNFEALELEGDAADA